MQITIYHNPDCGTSRNALAKLRKLGYDPQVVEYLKTPFSRAQIGTLLEQMQMSARELVRRNEALFLEMGLNEADVTKDELLDAMVENPVLVNRPIVVVQNGAKVSARLCRPSDLVASMVEPKVPQA